LKRAETDGVAQVAKDLGIHEAMIYYWRSKKKLGGMIKFFYISLQQ